MIQRGAEPFLFNGGCNGVLLIHGFTGSPSEMRLLGEYLNKQGFTVLAVRLPGHGTQVEEMAGTNALHWYSAVQDGYYILKGLCDKIFVAGLSMGGLLALKLANEYKCDKVVSLSTPIFIYDKRVKYLPIVKHFRRYVEKNSRSYDVDKIYQIGYNQTPLNSLSSLLDLINEVCMVLPKINTDVLIMQSKREHTVRPESADYIYKHIGSSNKKLVWLERSGHVVTLDSERETVFKNVADFLNQ